MSASPSEMDNILNGINNGLSSPLGLLALSLMQAGGPSRMPVSTGQALAQGFAGGQGMQGQVMQNAFQRMALQRQKAYLDALMGNTDQSQPQGAPQASPAADNPLMTAQTNTPTSMALDALASGQATPAQAQQISQTPLQNPLAISAQAPAGNNPLTGDPILQDPRIQKDLMFANFAPDAPTQTAWLTRARLDYDMLANTPAYKGAQAGAVAQAELGPKAFESVVGQLGRGFALNPGEGQIGMSGLSLVDPSTIQGLMRSFGISGGDTGAAPMTATGSPSPGIPGGNTAPPAPTTPAGGNMSGIAPAPVRAPAGAINTGNAIYQTNLAKDVAAGDAKHVQDLWDDAKTSSEGQQQLSEMWGSYGQGMYTGAGAGLSGDIAKWASAAGVPLSDETQKDLTNLQTFNKGAANLGVAVAKSLSSRPSQFEFKYLSGNAIANPQMQDTAIPLVMSQMGSVFQWKQMKAQYVDAQMRKGVNVRQAEANFDNMGSATPYALAILRQNSPQSANKLLNYLKSNNPAMYAKLGRETQWLQSNGLMPSTQDLMNGGY